MAYFIGNVTSLITEGDRIQSVKLQKLEEAKSFIDQKKLSRDLSRAILTHIRYHCRYNYVFDEGDLISSLPPNLRNEIHCKLAQSILSQLDFFESFTKSNSSLQTLGQIALKMRSISCNEGHFLFSKGDRAKEIYIQRTGESMIEFADGSTQRLSRGDVIGADCIVSPRRKSSVRCETFGEFYVLPISDVIAVLQMEYPVTWTRRWMNVVNDFNAALRLNGEQWIRIVVLDDKRRSNGEYRTSELSETTHFVHQQLSGGTHPEGDSVHNNSATKPTKPIIRGSIRVSSVSNGATDSIKASERSNELNQIRSEIPNGADAGTTPLSDNTNNVDPNDDDSHHSHSSFTISHDDHNDVNTKSTDDIPQFKRPTDEVHQSCPPQRPSQSPSQQNAKNLRVSLTEHKPKVDSAADRESQFGRSHSVPALKRPHSTRPPKLKRKKSKLARTPLVKFGVFERQNSWNRDIAIIEAGMNWLCFPLFRRLPFATTL